MSVLLIADVQWREAEPDPFSVVVFCGHRRTPQTSDVARQVGEGIARRSWRMVYGGGTSGLMGDVVQGARSHAGRVLGIAIPEYASGEADERVVPTLGERKEEMLRLSDAVLVLPGGLGTLDELAHAMAKKMDGVGGFDKPILIVNTHGYWDPLLDFYRSLNTTGIGRFGESLFEVFDEPHDALARIAMIGNPLGA